MSEERAEYKTASLYDVMVCNHLRRYEMPGASNGCAICEIQKLRAQVADTQWAEKYDQMRENVRARVRLEDELKAARAELAQLRADAQARRG